MGARQFASSWYWRLRTRGRIRGDRFFISPLAQVLIERGVTLTLERDVYISRGCELRINADSAIGAGSYLGRDVIVVGFSSIVIGSNVRMAERVSIHTENHRGGDLSAYSSSPITVGDDSWLAAGVVVTEGAWVGARTIVGANAVVRGQIPAGVVAAGVPARVIRARGDL